MYIGQDRLSVCVSVCLSVAAFPHYCTDPDVTWGMVGVPSSYALLGGFARLHDVVMLTVGWRADS